MEDIESIDLGSGDWPREFEAVTHFTFWLEWYHTHIHILVFSDLMTYPFWAWHDTTPWYRYTTLPFLFAFVYYSTLAYFHHFLDLTRQSPRWLDLRWALDDDIWIMMREWFDYLTMLLSHCTWLQRVGMIRDDVFFYLWDDGEWIMMIEWGDYPRTLMIITEHQWELSHDFGGVDMTLLDGCQFLVLVMWDLESTMFEVVVKGWVAIISWAYLLYHPRI